MVPFIKVKLHLLLVISILFGINKLKAQTVDTTLSAPITTAKHITATHSITLSTGFSGDGANGPITLDIVAPLLFNCTLLNAVPTASQNYVSTYVPRVPLTDATTIGAHTTCEVNQSIQYFDGLGRPLQTVQVKANPDGTKDMIQPIAYDQFGREAAKYLPYTTGTSATVLPGSYRSDALLSGAGQNKFYTTPPTGVSIDTIPSASTAFEASPLNRVTEQGAPGTDWQLGAHTNKILYASNDGTTYWAKQFGVDTSGVLVYQGTYGANQLNVTISEDENWKSTQTNLKLNTTEEYKDKEGHVVLKRTYNSNASTTPATDETLSTYYVYDDFGNLSYVLPPKAEADGATATSPIAQTTLANLCYQYQYDERNRLIKKRIPGKDWEYMVYNKLDQVVATQDGNQRVKNQWVITKYDALGRTILTGLWNNNTAIGQPALKALVYAQTAQWENKDNTQTYGYTLTNTYPASLNTVLSVNYYDDYTIPNLPTKYKPAQQSSMTKGLVTATRATVLNTINNTTPDMLWTVNYYDDKSRISDAYVQHYLGGVADTSNYDHMVNTYDFTNAVSNTTRTHYTKANTTNPAVTIANAFVYDHVGRKRQSFEQINGGTNVLLNQTDYNEVGQLLTKHLHSENNGASFLQNITYGYNERGWLTNSLTDGNLFNLSLNYNTAGTGITQQWNGNISAMGYNVNTGANAGPHQFLYNYDALNRLTQAQSTGGLLDESMTYDKIGNVTALTRGGANAASLAYKYIDASGNYSNQLAVVTTKSGASFRTYGYDANGSATSDGVNQTINYNLFNLPQSVVQGITTKATYTYSAAGNKLRNTGSDGTWDYINGIVYQTPIGSTNITISFIQTEEGRATRNVSDGTYHYEYNLKDHLGNTRISFDKGTNGLARIIQESEYYSFGLQHDLLHNDNRYLYNKKELQEELGQLDYGARFYDPVIARWTSIDRFAEKYKAHSSYVYVLDNPIKNIDANGDTVVVLHDVDGAHGFGHMAILIQGKDGGYRLYAKNGTNESSGTSGPEDKAGGDDVGTGKSYKSPAEFMTSEKNAPDKKTGEREYSEGFVIPTTKAEDKKAIAAAREELKKDYNVLGSNCASTVQKALAAAGKPDGSPSSAVGNAILQVVSPVIGTAVEKGPNHVYERIKKQNKGIVITPK